MTRFGSNLDGTTFDVVIVGAGMVGSTLAAALAGTGLRVGLIESRSPTLGPDGRSSALALGTVQLLRQVGAWDAIQVLGAAPIRRIRVSDGDFAGAADLSCTEIGAEALGYIVSNWVTQAGLQHVLGRADNIVRIHPVNLEAIELAQDEARAMVNGAAGTQTLRAKLLVGADGGHSRVRHLARIGTSGWDYGQACIVTTVVTERPHQQVAYERFQPSGPFAILPMTAAEGMDPERSCRSCVVWTVRAEERQRLMALTDPDFLAAMAPSFGSQLGRVLSASPRECYVPRRQHSDRYVEAGRRLALVGDAAHTTHPVGGQGVEHGHTRCYRFG